ncbi:hypothetical protein KKI24_10930 [bacterium]|nr:hypothetical protein [bacterium]
MDDMDYKKKVGLDDWAKPHIETESSQNQSQHNVDVTDCAEEGTTDPSETKEQETDGPEEIDPDSERGRRQRLAELETVIRDEMGRGTEADLKIGAAIGEIKSERLYKPKYKNFGEYMSQKWNYHSRSYGYKLIRAFEVFNDIKEAFPKKNIPLPKNVDQFDALAKIEGWELKAQVMEKVVQENPEGRITADLIKEVAQEHISIGPGEKSRKKTKKSVISVAKTHQTVFKALFALLDACRSASDLEAVKEPLDMLLQTLGNSKESVDMELVAEIEEVRQTNDPVAMQNDVLAAALRYFRAHFPSWVSQ